MSVELHLPAPVDADVIVVGAGPAGAATAAHLARRGIDTLLLDRSEFPRDKVCGDFVGPMALAELVLLGVTARREFQGTTRILSASMHLDGKRLATGSIPSLGSLPPYGRVIPRYDLDEWIRQAALDAGARFQGGAKVIGVERRNGTTEVEAKVEGVTTRWRGRVVVGADGSNSLVARILRRGKPFDRKDRLMAVRAYFHGVTGPGDRADLYFSEDSFPGYYWLFPSSAVTANVGLGMLSETIPPTDGHLRPMLLALIERDPAIAERLGTAELEGRVKGWPLTTYNHRMRIVGDGLVLVGDAAGLINPLNGEGIQYALVSGRWAAETIVMSMRAGRTDISALIPYRERVTAAMRPEMALATTVVSLIRRRDLNAVWLHSLRNICAQSEVDKGYADLAGGILAGMLPASRALSGPIVLGTLKQMLWPGAVQGGRTLLRPRAEFASVAREVRATMLGLARNGAHDFLGTVGWSAEVARALVELASQTAQDHLLGTDQDNASASRSGLR